LGHLLRRADQLDRANFLNHMRRFDVTTQQYAVLLALFETGPTSQRHVGQYVAMEPGNLHGVLKRLHARGLIYNRPSATDRRRREIALTPAGEGMLDTLRPLAEGASQVTLEPLTPEERAQLIHLLEKIAMTR